MRGPTLEALYCNSFANPAALEMQNGPMCASAPRSRSPLRPQWQQGHRMQGDCGQTRLSPCRPRIPQATAPRPPPTASAAKCAPALRRFETVCNSPKMTKVWPQIASKRIRKTHASDCIYASMSCVATPPRPPRSFPGIRGSPPYTAYFPRPASGPAIPETNIVSNS